MNYIDLDLNLIKKFLTVYECKSILLASKKLYISQPAITKSIKRLENYLKGNLFIRTSKGVEATNGGKEFYIACNNSLITLENGINKFSVLSELKEGYLNIGSSSTIIRKILLNFIKKFNKIYPNIIITITDANSEELADSLKDGRIDFAIINLPINNENNFNVIPIFKTNDCFIASVNFKKNHLTTDEIKKENLILQKRPSSNRDYFEKMCIENNVQLTPKMEIGSFGLITDFVAKNMGIAYTISEFVQDDIKNKRVKIIKTDLNIKPRVIALFTRNNSINNFATMKFIEEIKKYMN